MTDTVIELHIQRLTGQVVTLTVDEDTAEALEALAHDKGLRVVRIRRKVNDETGQVE